jgi:hydroxymethylglutaryl-CoA lyase
MNSSNGRRLYIQEVAPRDGFQIETRFVPTGRKVELIDALSLCGLSKIEATSFTSPKAIPSLADAERVMRDITRVDTVEYTVLVPNLRGAERALDCRVDELNLVMSASESHNAANLRMSCEQSLTQFAQIVEFVADRAHINASLSTAFGCPFEGEVLVPRISDTVQRFVDLGISRVSLCDTTGMANPAQVQSLCAMVRARWPSVQFTAHFHNTRGMGLANVIAALDAGIVHFDASLGGLGGCPFAPGASGNICTEDLVHMLAAMGYDTGVELDALLQCAAMLPALVGHDVPGQVLKAGKSSRRYAVPEGLATGPKPRMAGTDAVPSVSKG